MDTNNTNQPQPQIVYVQAPPTPKKGGGCLKVAGWCVVGFIGLGVLGGVISAAGSSSSSTSRSSSDAAVTATYAASSAAPATVIANTGKPAATLTGGTATEKPATPRPEPTPPLKIGDTIESKYWRVKVTDVKRTKTLEWSGLGNKADAVGEWLLVNVEATNIGTENYGTNSWDWELKTASGFTIKPSSEGEAYMYASTVKRDFLMKQVPPTATVKGVLVFDVPPGTEGIDLVFKQEGGRPVNVG